MSELVLMPPHPRQVEFMKARTKYVAFGGARGGGKSWALRTKAILMAQRYPGIAILIIRSTYKELYENHIRPLCDTLRCYSPKKRDRLARYVDSKKHIVFPNGSRILFGYCENDADAARYQGTEVDVLMVDEATHQSEERIIKLVACVRGVNDFPKRIYYTCNPGGVGHSWVKRLFVDKAYKANEDASEYTFIQSLVTDNKALAKSDPDYIKQLEALPPKLREAWLYGRWDIFEGQFFEEFRETPDSAKVQELGVSAEQLAKEHRWTHVVEPFDPPSNWRIYRSYDWGFAKPFSCAWYAISPDDVAYRILELYGCKRGIPNEGVRWTNEEQFAEIARIEREHPWLAGKEVFGIADPSIWDGSKGKSAAQVAKEYGVFFKPGINDRIPGWMQIRYRMRFDEIGRCKLYFFKNCEAIIRTMPLMMFDEHRVEDIDTSLEDHACDELRYFCQARKIAPPLGGTKSDPLFNDPLNDERTKENKDPYRSVWRF